MRVTINRTSGLANRPRRLTRWFLMPAALALVLAIPACGGGDGDDSDRADKPKESSPNLALAGGEGIAKFIVSGFNEGLVRCNYRRTVKDLRRLSTLFAPDVQSGLLGQYSDEEYTGPAIEDESAHSSVNPPPDRARELADLLSLFPGGVYRARQVPGYDIIDWPFNYSPAGADVIEQLDGASFAKVCRAVVDYLSGGSPSAMKARYRPAPSGTPGTATWVLAFPRGSGPDQSFEVVDNRELVVKRIAEAWTIFSFKPVGSP